jgi:hypothetical protein
MVTTMLRRSLLVSLALLGTVHAVADTPGPHPNSFRAYPPSCLADPLPTDPTGPTWVFSVDLPLYSNVEPEGFETDQVTFWRVPCESGKSALLARIDRPTGATDGVPTMPTFIFELENGLVAARIASEPNTVRSGIVAGTQLFYTYPSDDGLPSASNFAVVVFENEPRDFSQTIDFSAALQVLIDPGVPCGFSACPPPPTNDIPAYDATLYPDASLPLSISGYVAGNWYDPAHSGEGIQTEIGDLNGGDSFLTSRYLTIAWYTYDETGRPYWLFGSGNFTAGDHQVQVQLNYSSGGGFAGAGSAATSNPWGTLTVEFPTCFTMQFQFSSVAAVPLDLPRGSGSRTWQRLTMMNGLTCE